MDTISRLARRVACACATAAILTGCSSGGSSPGGLTPSGAMTPFGVESRLSAQVPGTSTQSNQGFSHYYVVDLGTLGGTASVANSINNRGWIAGISKLAGNTAVRGTLWVNAQKVNLGTLGGPNSAVGWPVKNDRGVVAGFSDLAQTDPLAENFCGLGSGKYCAGFRWQNNGLTPLSTLGGNNSFAAGANDAGQIAGFAETGVHDATCGSPQVLDYYATIWNASGRPRALPPLSGDTISQSVAIDESGAAVGASGPCGPPNNLGYGTAHALLWHASGAPADLGTLGGTTANIATAINDSDEIVGQSAVTGNTTYHAFRWHGAMSDLGTLPGDFLSEALGLNSENQVVGYSCDSSGNCRGVVWQNGAMSDLNLLVPRSQLYIVYAGDINDKGWIVGQAVDLKTGRAPAVLLIPGNGAPDITGNSARKVILPTDVRRQLQHHHGIRPFITGPATPQ